MHSSELLTPSDVWMFVKQCDTKYLLSLSLSIHIYVCMCVRARDIYIIHHPEQKRGGRVRPSLLMWCETKQNEKRKRWTEADSKNHLVSNKICHTHTQMFSTHIVTRTFPLHITYIITPTYTRISRTKSSPVSRKRCATSRSRGYRRSTNRAMAAEHWSEWMRQIKRGCEYFSWIFFQEPESIPFEMNQVKSNSFSERIRSSRFIRSSLLFESCAIYCMKNGLSLPSSIPR